jgi:hypothetical protein
MRGPLALAALAGLAGVAGLAGCRPPPTDSAAARVSLIAPAGGPSEPIASPDVTGAVWAATSNPLRLVYGIPGQPVLLALECLDPKGPEARLTITRHAPADPGASAILALIGNGSIARIPVDAASLKGQRVWTGEAPALTPDWDALKPEREATVTVPGAGLLKLNPSPLPMALVEACRVELTAPPPPLGPADPESAPAAAGAAR